MRRHRGTGRRRAVRRPARRRHTRRRVDGRAAGAARGSGVRGPRAAHLLRHAARAGARREGPGLRRGLRVRGGQLLPARGGHRHREGRAQPPLRARSRIRRRRRRRPRQQPRERLLLRLGQRRGLRRGLVAAAGAGGEGPRHRLRARREPLARRTRQLRPARSLPRRGVGAHARALRPDPRDAPLRPRRQRRELHRGDLRRAAAGGPRGRRPRRGAARAAPARRAGAAHGAGLHARARRLGQALHEAARRRPREQRRRTRPRSHRLRRRPAARQPALSVDGAVPLLAAARDDPRQGWTRSGRRSRGSRP